jgi:hypothetical protein
MISSKKQIITAEEKVKLQVNSSTQNLSDPIKRVTSENISSD